MNVDQPVIGVIGYGTMGHAFVEGLKRVKINSFLVFDRSAEALRDLEPHERAMSAQQILADADLVVLAVKPQQLTELLTTVHAAPRGIVLSILAGTRLARLSAGFRTDRIVRAMPNLAATVGESVTGWVAGAGVTAAGRQLVGSVLSAVGHELELGSDAAIDALTAVAGSGTGYVMAFAQALQAAAERVGFEPELAAELVRQTMIGGGKLLAEDARSFSQLKAAVTSKGGTTEAALAVMPEAELEALMLRAVVAAHERARTLGER